MTLPNKVAAFRALHVPGRPLLMPNPWDAGTAKLLASLGFQALDDQQRPRRDARIAGWLRGPGRGP
ncbi:MAG: isocitrate lyase/phosphoenolpyruvate mutase family protein [Pseudonocardiaceae bacterium]